MEYLSLRSAPRQINDLAAPPQSTKLESAYSDCRSIRCLSSFGPNPPCLIPIYRVSRTQRVSHRIYFTDAYTIETPRSYLQLHPLAMSAGTPRATMYALRMMTLEIRKLKSDCLCVGFANPQRMLGSDLAIYTDNGWSNTHPDLTG